jgi:PEP-CTERM motif
MSNFYINKINFLKSFTPLAIASTVLFGSNPSAQAVQFNFSYTPGTTLEQMIGYEMAGGIWAAQLSDNVSVNLYIQMDSNLPQGVIGGALPGVKAFNKFEDFQTALGSDRKSADDTLASNNMFSHAKGFHVQLQGNGKNNEIKAIQTINMTRANAKALGMLNGNDSALDGVIVMNTLTNVSKPVSWNYNFTGNVPSNQLDFLSVAVHEMGHNLGFVSGTDDPGLLSVVTDNARGGKGIDGKNMGYVNVLDMFRYSSASAVEGMPDLSVNGQGKYFSIDGGSTALAYFSTGKDTTLGADGKQGSHWKQQGNAVGIMDPLLSAGQKRSITALDRRAMDVIGWDVQQIATDLATLQLQAKQRLAAKLRVTVAWLEANPTEAARRLSQDRSQEVDAMLQNSQIYEWGQTPGQGQCQNNRPGCRWQDAFWEHGYWETYDPQTTTAAQSVPEPSSIAGLFGLVGLGILSRRKGQKK